MEDNSDFSFGRGNIGLALLSDIDQRAVCTSAAETAARVANEVCDINSQQGQESGFCVEVWQALNIGIHCPRT